MPLKVRRVWVDPCGHQIPNTDNKRYDAPCAWCNATSPDGSNRFGGEFLCDACLRELLKADGEDK